MTGGEAAGARGRKPATSRAELEHVAFELFDSQGFEQVTVDDIATAAGIGRRTFFRYFASKNDVVWGEFDAALEEMHERLRASPGDIPLMAAIRASLLDFNRVDEQEEPWLRRRMRFILRVPALQAHSTLRYADWRAVLAEFIGRRLGVPADSMVPQAIAHATLGVSVAAYEQWLARPEAGLQDLLAESMDSLATGFGLR
jgi:mycofactocin system transcriptional regulator